jgi:hypothetical protein
MEVLKLFEIPLFSSGFDMTSLPVFLELLAGATLTERKTHIVADFNYSGVLDLRLDLTADKQHPFKYHQMNGQKVAIGGDIAQATVTASFGSWSGPALKATGLHAPVAEFLQDLVALDSQDALADLAEPGPIRVKPAGSTGTPGNKLYVPGVHAIFDVRGVPGLETIELKHGDKVEVSDERFPNIKALTHDLTSDGQGGWLLMAPNHASDAIDLQLANGHALTQHQALAYLMLDA